MGLTDLPLNNEAFCAKFVEKKYLLSGRVIFRVSRNLKHRPTRVTLSLANILNVDINCKGLILLPFTQ